MLAEKITTDYPEVEHLVSFWECVWNFSALKEAEGNVASALLTDYIDIAGAMENEPYNNPQFMPRTSALQEKAFTSLQAFLDDPGLVNASNAYEAVWVTAGV